MQLCALSPAEIAFFAQPPLADSAALFAHRLERGLAAALRARLRVDIACAPIEGQPGETVPAPRWHIDAGLAGLWLARRLGGRVAAGSSPFVPAGLRQTLDEILAERWLDAPGQLPAMLAWRVRAAGCDAVLKLDLPQSPHDMTRWAQGRISQ